MTGHPIHPPTPQIGIRRLLSDGTYLACFPLHEGRYDKPHSSGATLDRRLLYLEWARPIKFYKKQPLCLIRKYFGDKIALYFCWLGFYTKMLVIPSIVGMLCFLYGLATMGSEYNTPSKEICDYDGIGNTTLCPLCDKACSYQKLRYPFHPPVLLCGIPSGWNVNCFSSSSSSTATSCGS